MSDGPGRDEAADPDMRKLAQDWITLWQSELAGLAVDREAQESWQAVLRMWAAGAAGMLRAMPQGGPYAGGAAGSGRPYAANSSPQRSAADPLRRPSSADPSP